MGNPKICRLARILAFAIGLAASSPEFSTAAENVYKFTRGGDGFYGYTDALIALDISNGIVTGQLRPLLGDRTAPVNVRGTYPQDGVLNLTIDLPAGPKTYKFTKQIVGQKIVWQDPDESGRSIYRYNDGQLPDAAQTLGEYECGASYRSMVAELLPRTTRDRLNAFLATDQQASSFAVTYDAYDKKRDLWTKRTTVTLGEFLKLQLGTSEHDRSMLVQFRTAVGTEPYLAKWMRGSGLFKFADLDPGGCDGMDRSYFAIDRGLLFEGNGLSQEKFGRYIEARLR